MTGSLGDDVASGLPSAYPATVSLGSHTYVAGVRLAGSEHTRRQRAGLGAVTSYAAAFAMWELPTGGTVPANQLPEVHRRALRVLPDAAVTETDDGFERVATRPLDVVYLVAIRSSCRRGFDSFGDRWWAPVRRQRWPCARTRRRS